jgi:protein involved in polysaccharide export with SLBB domain
VPPIGKVVGIAGHVKRPAIYELSKPTTIKEMIDQAGGALFSADPQRIQIERYENNEKKMVLDLNLADISDAKMKLVDGDLIKIFSIQTEEVNVVFLKGNVSYPGKYEYKSGMKVSDIISNEGDVLPETYFDYAVIESLNPPELSPKIVPFNLGKILFEKDENEDLTLQAGDTLILYNKWEFRDKPLVHIHGEVRNPGTYNLIENMKVKDLILAAGNMLESAYMGDTEIIRRRTVNGMLSETEKIIINLNKALSGDNSHNILLESNDVIFMKNIPEWRENAYITIRGEVRSHGKYLIMKGERISALIERAGGYTENAYLKGAVFTRRSSKKRQQERIDAILQELEKETLRIGSEDSPVSDKTAEARMFTLKTKSLLINKLRKIKPSGRVIISLDDVEKMKGSLFDIVLEDGDELYIPMKPSTISVVGQVNNPSDIIYRDGHDVSDYLDMVGGLNRNADEEFISVIKSDGTVIRSKGIFSDVFSYKLEPGDSIIIPEKIVRYTGYEIFKDSTKLLYEIAVSIAALSFIF